MEYVLWDYMVFLTALVRQTGNSIPSRLLWKQLKFVEGVSPMFETDITISNNWYFNCRESFYFYQWKSWICFSQDTFPISPEKKVCVWIEFPKIIRLGWPLTFLECSSGSGSNGWTRKHCVWNVCCVFMDTVGSCHLIKGGIREGSERLVDGQQIEDLEDSH